MTPRQLDTLAAWWRTGGSCPRAAMALGLSKQTVRNHLNQARRVAGARSTLELALSHIEEIESRNIPLPRAPFAEVKGR